MAAAVLSNRYITRSLFARQGHRPGGRGGGQAAHRDRLEARRAGRGRARGSCSWRSSASRSRRRRTPPRRTGWPSSRRSWPTCKAEQTRAGGTLAGGEAGRPAPAPNLREAVEQTRQELEQAQQRGRLRPGRASSSTASCQPWRRSSRTRSEALGRAATARVSSSRKRSTRRTSPRSSAAGRASPCPSCSKARCRSCCTWKRSCTSASSARTRR